MAVITTGLTVVGASALSAFFAEIIDFNWTGMTREDVDTSNFSTTGAKTFLPSTLYDAGEISVELIFAPDTAVITPLTAAAETVTVTYTDAAPASTMAATMYMKDFQIAGPLEDRMTATATLKVADDITHTAQ